MGISNQIPNSRISQAGVVPNEAARPVSKTCTRCNEEKPFKDFYKNPQGKYNLMSRCKPCFSQNAMAWAKQNKEKTNDIAARYRANHKEELSQRFAEYYEKKKFEIAKKKKEYRKTNVEQRSEYCKQWRKKNPTKVSEYAHRRRLRKMSGDIRVFTDDDWRYLLHQFNYSCAYCGEKENLTKDHVIPISRGGRHSVGNIVPACQYCNFSKHNRLIVEWKKVS